MYNVHALIHLADDCANHSCSLNYLSSFPYENCLGVIKRLVRNSNNPISQVVKRVGERTRLTSIAGTSPILRPKSRDDTVLLKQGEICILTKNLGKYYHGKVIPSHRLRNLYDVPCPSSLLQISRFRSSLLSELSEQRIEKKRIVKKVVRVAACDDPSECIFIPFKHTQDL